MNIPSEGQSLDGKLASEFARLKEILLDMRSALVAFSGGTDSTLLLKVAKDILKDRVVAALATSPLYPEREEEAARKIAASLGVPLRCVPSGEMEIGDFVANTPRRCYFCKIELFGTLMEVALQEGLAWVADGTNVDDSGDYRPGRIAAKELGIRSPLAEAGMTKEHIRELSRALGLPTADKPAMACLSSRIPYGTTITPEIIAQVGRAEEILMNMGVSHVRVRHHGDLARIEIGVEEDIPRLVAPDLRYRIVDEFRALGYTYITMDLEGYRTGSLNEVLDAATIDSAATSRASAADTSG